MSAIGVTLMARNRTPSRLSELMGKGILASRWLDEAIMFVPTDETIDGRLQAALRGGEKGLVRRVLSERCSKAKVLTEGHESEEEEAEQIQ